MKTKQLISALFVSVLSLPAFIVSAAAQEDEEPPESIWSGGYGSYHFQGLVGSESSNQFPQFKAGGLIDLRIVHTDESRGWLDGGLGKARYGGLDGDEKTLARPSMLNGWAATKLTEDLGAYGRVNLDLEREPANPKGRGEHLDLMESFVSYEPTLGKKLQLKNRAGIFFPDISLENTAAAWTSPYSLTPSAINSWVGEELRATGLESKLEYSELFHTAGVGASLFGYNDPAGSLLAWRGWALGDRQSGFRDRLPFENIQAITPGGIFEKQAAWVEPFTEIDDEPGFYVNADFRDSRYLTLNYMHYDNLADREIFNGEQYAWHTRFDSVGLKVPLPGGFELLSQFMEGDSGMGKLEQSNPKVDIDFRSFYALISYSRSSHRFTFRYDWFRVDDKDDFHLQDDNSEEGDAFMLAYIYSLLEDQEIVLEALRILSDRPERDRAGLPSSDGETLFQLAYRLKIG